jgi:hypothetical protein
MGKKRRVDHGIDPNCGGYGDAPYDKLARLDLDRKF